MQIYQGLWQPVTVISTQLLFWPYDFHTKDHAGDFICKTLGVPMK